MERVRSTTRPFQGRLIQVRVDQVTLPVGRLATREIVEHPGAVGILPLTSTGKIVLVEQHRYVVGRKLMEIPAGTREPGEPPEITARRELLEETGYRCEDLREIARFFTSPGWATEEIVLYQAHAARSAGPEPIPDEILNVVEVSPAEIPVLIGDGLIADGKTITALCLYLTTLT